MQGKRGKDGERERRKGKVENGIMGRGKGEGEDGRMGRERGKGERRRERETGRGRRGFSAQTSVLWISSYEFCPLDFQF